MAAIAQFVNDDDGRYKTEKPYIYHGPDLGFPSSNLTLKESPLSLTDLRNVPDFRPTVETLGFCFIEHKSKELPTVTDESNSKAYALEMTKVLKEVLGASIVFPVQTRVWFLSPILHLPLFSIVLTHQCITPANAIVPWSKCLCLRWSAAKKLKERGYQSSSWKRSPHRYVA